MRFLTESFFNSEVISNFSVSNLFNAFNELKQFYENSICVDHVWSSSHQSFFFKDLYIRWTYAHFFAVGLMKADVLRSDYMYSNDLIVLFLLTYFSIRGRRRLITDNVFFFIQCDFKWYRLQQFLYQKYILYTKYAHQAKKNWRDVLKKTTNYRLFFQNNWTYFFRDMFYYCQFAVEYSLAVFFPFWIH